MKLSVIVPCFNEEGVVAETYRRLVAVMRTIASIDSYELVFINDGSRDKTLELLHGIADKDSSVVVVNFSRNFGHQPAVTAGLRVCTGDYAAVIDSDLQDPPELIADMLRMAINEPCNVVYAVRNTRKGESFFKLLTAKMYYRILNYISETEMPVDTGDFRLMDRKVVTAFNALGEKQKYIRGLVTWLGFKQLPIYYDREERFAGETKYPFFKMLKFALTGLLYFSKKPLMLATNLGFLSILIGLLLAVYTVIAKYIEPQSVVSGWASLIISVIFFGGVQLLTIGVLGAYIGNIFDEVKNRPEFVIDQVYQKK